MQIIVVEGRHDEAKIKEIYPNAFVITTNGREISDKTLDMIEKYSIDNEIILFLDPDSPGEKIRKIIASRAKNVKHAFIRQVDSISKNRKKVGVEHASKEIIKASLENLYSAKEYIENITLNDLYALNLIGNKDSKNLRSYVSNKLNIGCPNAKTFLKRVNEFNITLDEIERYINERESNS